jgi:hypothetical protein
MSFLSACVRGICTLVALGATIAVVHAAGDRELPTRQETPAEKLHKALDQPVTLQFTSPYPLSELLAFLRDKARLPVTIDHAELAHSFRGLKDKTVESFEQPLHFEKVQLRVVMRTALRPYNLTFVIADNSLVITSPEQAVLRQVRQTVSVDFNDVSMKAALRQLARTTATNVVLDSRVSSEHGQTAVTLVLEEVSLETAVRLVAELGGLKAVTMGNVLFVTTEARANKIRAEAGGQAFADRLPPGATRPLLPPLQAPNKKTAPEP